jgi:predicted esterase
MNRVETRTRLPGLALALALALMTLFAAIVQAQKLGTVPRVAPSQSAPRGETLEWTSPAGKLYWYRLPKKLSAKKPPCLIFMLHGTGLNHGWSFWNYPIARGSFRPDDIIVSPDGLTPGGGDTFNFVQGKKDGDQIAGLIKLFKKQFPIARVYLYGHSQGAFFCYWFVGAHPELVNGIVAHAGNVLDVRHPKLARQKIGIGILHGKADAVVSVECAYRTEKIYREQGYQKLKLYVVEGLTKRSGHWPLPGQVLEMFDWLDRVTVDTADGVIAVALSELAKAAPDLLVVVEAAADAKRLLKKHKGKDRGQLKAKLDAIEAFIEEAAAAEADHLRTCINSLKPMKETECWPAHFRLVNPAMKNVAAWRKTLRAQIAQAKRHEKAVARALKSLSKRPSKKAFVAAVKALEESTLADRYGELRDLVARVSENPPRGVGEKQLAACRQVIQKSFEQDELGQGAARGALESRLRSFRSAHPDWFPSGASAPEPAR